MFRPLVIAALLMLCMACAQPKPVPPMLGSDRDEHGCIGSAGYSWCAREAACVRPWELAQQRELAAGKEAFDAVCSAASGG